MKVLKREGYLLLGYSEDKRKRRRQHRNAAAKLVKSGGLFDFPQALFLDVCSWHLTQARLI